jgi:hypothetical protein
MAKAECQAAQTVAEAKLALVQKQADDAKSNGPDSLKYEIAALATAIAEVRTQIEALT